MRCRYAIAPGAVGVHCGGERIVCHPPPGGSVQLLMEPEHHPRIALGTKQRGGKNGTGRMSARTYVHVFAPTATPSSPTNNQQPRFVNYATRRHGARSP